MSATREFPSRLAAAALLSATAVACGSKSEAPAEATTATPVPMQKVDTKPPTPSSSTCRATDAWSPTISSRETSEAFALPLPFGSP